MMARQIKANQTTAARRRIFFHLVDATDGMTAETGEAGGQPQISTNGAGFTGTGIGVLVAIGNGRYYAELTQAAVATAGDLIESRYKSANTAECPGDSVEVVGFDSTTLWATAVSGLRSITINVRDQSANPVPYFTADIYNSDATVLLARLTDSDGGGSVAVGLDDGTYKVRLFASRWTPTNATETLTVTADATVTYTGTALSAPVSADPSLCTVYGYAFDAEGAATNGAVLDFYAKTVDVSTGFTTTAKSTVTTGPTGDPAWTTGYFEIELLRGIQVTVRCATAVMDGSVLTIPDAGSAQIDTLL